jgi:UDP-sulfoquinovose synthase
MSNILILGGDGYLGWPAAMYFSRRGHEVTVVDNYFRRHIGDKINAPMLYPVATLVERANTWYEQTGYEIKVVIADLAESEVMRGLFTGQNISYNWSIDNTFSGIPDTVIHYAEQPSAPYSLMNYQTANFTLTNNLLVTNNLLFAVRDLAPEVHIIKLGTMGEYGTPNIDIEEGWIDIESKGRKGRFLFPREAGSLYHTTKIMDTDLMWFGVRMWGLRVTDLMQGPVYGIETEESKIHSNLKTIFNYDEIFGTVVNRFITQSVIGYPLTVYGKGGQSRGYLNLEDSLQCAYISHENPADLGELRIFNQIMETFTVNELAELTKKAGEKLGMNVKIKHIQNPREEQEDHYYNPVYKGLVDLGVKPHLLTIHSMIDMIKIVKDYKKNINQNTIFNGIKW